MAHIWWTCPEIVKYWAKVQILIKEVTGLEIPIEPLTFLLAAPMPNIVRPTRKLISFILTAARCCVAASWRKTATPALNTIKKRIGEVMTMERLTANIKQRTPAFEDIWEPWFHFSRAPRSTQGVTYPKSILLDAQKLKRLQQSGDCFVQDGPCNDIAPQLHKCRECRLDRFGRSNEQRDSAVFCRFFHFRRLHFNKHGLLREGGFLTPNKYDAEAINLWLPVASNVVGLDLDTAKYILANIGDHFCKLVMSEKEVMASVDPQKQVAWKRAVRGVREMCDVCDTTIFNLHWVCPKCGFGVCMDCYRMKKKSLSHDDDGTEAFSWLKCVKGQLHEPENLMPTQIVPGKALYDVGDLVHSVRGKWGIKSNCPCSSKHRKPLSKPSLKEDSKQSTTSGAEYTNGMNLQPSTFTELDPVAICSKTPSAFGPLSWLTNLPNTNVNKENKDNLFTSMLKPDSKPLPSFASFGRPAPTLQTFNNSILTPMSSNNSGFLRNLLNSSSSKQDNGEKSTPKILDDIFASLVQTKTITDTTKKPHGLPIQPSLMGFNTPHYWLCDNRLLCLQDPSNKSNWNVFRECWKQGQVNVNI
ncbi:hypothetical protein FKM82_017799 [Ascaphus truei]